MSEHEIRFNYEKAMGQARELKSIASSLKKVGENQMTECLGKVEKNWTGSNSEAYLKKGKKVQTKITTSSKNISAAADALETMARNIYNAEMAALRAAKERSYR